VNDTLLVSQSEQVLPRAGLSIPRRRRRSAGGRVAGAQFQRLLGWLETQSLFVAGVAGVAIVTLATIPLHLGQDGWLALVGGRYIASHGVPSVDTLNILTHGARWLDQQWLAQLLLYRVDQLGGLFLYGAVYVTLTSVSLGAAIAAARSLGGTERTVLWTLIPSAFLYIAGSFAIRTQGLAYPLFVAVLCLLAREVREPSRWRVYLVLPLLVVWANLHGSVTLGVGLAVLYGITLLVEDVRNHRLRRFRMRTIVFLLVPSLCLFATPYGFSIVSYYRETLLNPTFSQLIVEWRPVTSVMMIAVPCLGLAGAVLWLLGRSWKRTPLFDQLALLLLAAGAVFAVRNISWFGLATLMLLPTCIAGLVNERGAAPRRSRLNLAIASLALAALAGSVIATALRPASWYEHTYNPRTLASVEAIVKQDPKARIFADVRYSDWLLWHDPALAGRLAYDTRLELLTARQLRAIAGLGEVIAPHAYNILAPFNVLVLDRSDAFTKLLLSRPGVHVVSKNRDAVIALTRRR
jgi:hypothetical protein